MTPREVWNTLSSMSYTSEAIIKTSDGVGLVPGCSGNKTSDGVGLVPGCSRRTM